MVHGSTRDPSTAWRTASKEWRFLTFSGHVSNLHDQVKPFWMPACHHRQRVAVVEATPRMCCMQVYRSSDFRTWSSSNDTLFQPAECPSLFKIPRTIYTNGTHSAINVASSDSGGDAPTHVYKGSGIHCLVNGQHAKVTIFIPLPLEYVVFNGPTCRIWALRLYTAQHH